MCVSCVIDCWEWRTKLRWNGIHHSRVRWLSRRIKVSVLQVSMRHDLIAFITVTAHTRSARRMLLVGRKEIASVLLAAGTVTDGLSTVTDGLSTALAN